jgi:hypothetical protein
MLINGFLPRIYTDGHRYDSPQTVADIHRPFLRPILAEEKNAIASRCFLTLVKYDLIIRY